MAPRQGNFVQFEREPEQNIFKEDPLSGEDNIMYNKPSTKQGGP